MIMCSSAITSFFPCRKKEEKNQPSAGGDVDNNQYILLSTFHVSSLQSQQKKLLHCHFTVPRQKEDNYNMNFLTSQYCKKLLITVPY